MPVVWCATAFWRMRSYRGVDLAGGFGERTHGNGEMYGGTRMLRLPQGLNPGLRLPESVHQSVAAAYSLRRLNFETSVCAILIRLAVPLL